MVSLPPPWPAVVAPDDSGRAVLPGPSDGDGEQLQPRAARPAASRAVHAARFTLRPPSRIGSDRVVADVAAPALFVLADQVGEGRAVHDVGHRLPDPAPEAEEGAIAVELALLRPRLADAVHRRDGAVD